MARKRQLLSIRDGKLRWKCEHCGASVMCAPEHGGAESECPYCHEQTTFPKVEDFDRNKQFRWSRLVLPGAFAWFLALGAGLGEYSTDSTGNITVPVRWMPAISFSIGALAMYALAAWALSLLYSKLYRKLNQGKLLYKRRAFVVFLPVVAVAFAAIRASS